MINLFLSSIVMILAILEMIVIMWVYGVTRYDKMIVILLVYGVTRYKMIVIMWVMVSQGMIR